MTYKANKLLMVVITILLVLSNGLWVWHNQAKDDSSRTKEAVQAVKYPLLDPALIFYQKEDLVVNIQELRNYLTALPEKNKDWTEMSIYFEALNTGASVSVNPNVRVWPASLSKLPVGMVAMKKVEKGDWDLKETPFVLTDNLVDKKFNPDMVGLVGKTFSLDFLLDRLLLDSDNTAYNMIVSRLSEAELNSITEAVGLDVLADTEGRMSAKDYTRLLRALYVSTYLNEEYSEKILNLLNNSEFTGYVRAGLPKDVKFSHKWGLYAEKNVFADSGIVYAKDRPYIISVMLQAKGDDHQKNEAKSQELMKEIGEKTYQFMTKGNLD